jgi:hypothetical protein
MSANELYSGMASYHVYSPFGIPPERKFGESCKHHVNLPKISHITRRIRTFVSDPIYLCPGHSVYGLEVKSAKVAGYPVSDNTFFFCGDSDLILHCSTDWN